MKITKSRLKEIIIEEMIKEASIGDKFQKNIERYKQRIEREREAYKRARELQKNKNEGRMKEQNFEKVKLPANVDRFLNKFVQSMQDTNLNRIRRSAILYKVINASGMSIQQLMADIQKIKKGLKRK